MTADAQELPPVHIDRERMAKTLAGPFYTLPHGLTPEHLREIMSTLGRAIADAREAERARIVDELDAAVKNGDLPIECEDAADWLIAASKKPKEANE